MQSHYLADLDLGSQHSSQLRTLVVTRMDRRKGKAGGGPRLSSVRGLRIRAGNRFDDDRKEQWRSSDEYGAGPGSLHCPRHGRGVRRSRRPWTPGGTPFAQWGPRKAGTKVNLAFLLAGRKAAGISWQRLSSLIFSMIGSSAVLA
jgi:hypothetical protein